MVKNECRRDLAVTYIAEEIRKNRLRLQTAERRNNNGIVKKIDEIRVRRNRGRSR